MPQPQGICPIGATPPAAGGQIAANVGQDGKQKLVYTYTPIGSGQGNPHAPCAFRELSPKAVINPHMDVTQACRRCTRVVRLRSTN